MRRADRLFEIIQILRRKGLMRARDLADLPPLMFDEQEIEALVLGARIVESWADAELAGAAANVITKVETVVPERLRRHMAETALLAPENHYMEPISFDPSVLRKAIRQRYKVHFRYRDGTERETERSVRPLALAFFGPVWLLASWCELREDFRSFRLDRIFELAVLGESFQPEVGKTMQDFFRNDNG